MKRAFTLIELLVVIAIIAILAAILFPVFAQAKGAAKKTASLSNVKQLGTSVQIYQGDSDDVLPVMAAWANDGAYVAAGGVGIKPWTQIIQPYMKSYDLLLDPQAPASIASPANFFPQVNKLFCPQYGYNSYIANVIPNSDGTFTHSPKSSTSITRPADTVLFAQKYSSSETQDGDWSGAGYWFGPGSYFLDMAVDPPDCGSNTRVCAEGWNNNTYYGGTGGAKVLRNVEAAGAFTGGASLRGTKQAVVVWADGHASNKAPGALALSTNYNPVKDAQGIPTQNSSQIVLGVDKTQDQWYGEF